MDPTLWKEPEQFNPERFLSDDGTKTVRPDFFIPFGVGRRMCLGDVLAKAELFLFFSSMLHVFNLQLPEGAELPDLCGQAGVTVSPKSFKVKYFLNLKFSSLSLAIKIK
jgi:26-hydroxylase